MVKCKWCGRSGIFLPVNNNGICQNCEKFIQLEVNNRIRILNDSIKLVKDTKNVDTLISRLDLIIQQTNELMKYEEYGISTVNPPPSHINKNIRESRDSIIIDHLNEEYNSTLSKVELPGITSRRKITALNKLLIKNADTKEKLNDSALIDGLDNKIKSDINRIQFDSLMDDAKKAEFKNNKKTALNKYYEALYFLRHDEIDDALQNDHIIHIEKKIVELGGELK